MSYDVMLKYICAKHVHHNVLKNENIFKKRFLIFMKFGISVKNYESI